MRIRKRENQVALLHLPHRLIEVIAGVVFFALWAPHVAFPHFVFEGLFMVYPSKAHHCY
jgi:hypothetical protein